MFAIAIWTPSEKRLVLARDRMGIKPLYVHRNGRDICFGSELKSIFAHPEVDRVLDLDALNCYLSLNYVPGKSTLVQGIEKLPPGHWLEWRHGLIQTEPFWRLPHGIESRWTADAAAERLDELLIQSVREHLISDVPLGVWISGDLDSSTILHYAAAASPHRLKTFSVSFKGQSCDEGTYSRDLARRYGTDHEELDLIPDANLADAIGELPYYHDEPGADSGALGECEAAMEPPYGLSRHLFFDQGWYLPDNILAIVDRISMAHSLEVRPPFLDHRIVAFAASLPLNLKIRGLTQKYVLRRLMKDRLPRFVLHRKKEGFDIPAQEWLRGPLRPLLLDVLSKAAVKQTKLFRWKECSLCSPLT